MRLADPDELRAYGRRAAEELAVMERVSACLTENGIEPIDAWLTPDGARAALVLRSAPVRADALAREGMAPFKRRRGAGL